jgi:hypothetical protein
LHAVVWVRGIRPSLFHFLKTNDNRIEVGSVGPIREENQIPGTSKENVPIVFKLDDADKSTEGLTKQNVKFSEISSIPKKMKIENPQQKKKKRKT